MVVMQYLTRHQKLVWLRRSDPGDHANLHAYLQGLSEDTRKRFGPHPYEWEAITEFYNKPEHSGYLAIDAETNSIVAYAIIKAGYLEHDAPRLQSYGLQLDHGTDCTFAPSVADEWQSSGIGQGLLNFIIDELNTLHKRKLILWGGVQADNEKAVRFYKKNEFRQVGEFWYNGNNYDMVRWL